MPRCALARTAPPSRWQKPRSPRHGQSLVFGETHQGAALWLPGLSFSPLMARRSKLANPLRIAARNGELVLA